MIEATTALFAANMALLVVIAIAFASAGKGRDHQSYWGSWVDANLVLAMALAVFLVETHLPPLLVALLPNGLLVLGFALRWRAAREFSGRGAPAILSWGPAVLFAALAAPLAPVSYGAVFALTNVMVAALALLSAFEFWRDRHDGLHSRYGLVVGYCVMSASFGFRIVQGVAEAGTMAPALPHDQALLVHLMIALVTVVVISVFSLSLAFERGNLELRHAASHDALTGLLNRGAFETRLRARLGAQAPQPFTLALFDIDHFKSVNDRYGHAAGDEALRRCAALCRAHLREGDLAARIGGEEFALVLGDADAAVAARILDRIRNAVATADMRSGVHRFRITMSGGLYASPGRGDFDHLMRVVDARLYAAKNGGRNRIEAMAA